MVTNKNEHTTKTSAKQGADEATPKPIKIGLRRVVAGRHHAGETAIPASSLKNISRSSGSPPRCPGSSLCWG
jgi:hypothetical protein